MDNDRLLEFIRRVRVAIALLLGYGGGKALTRALVGVHESEYFIAGFVVTTAAALLLFHVVGRPRRNL